MVDLQSSRELEYEFMINDEWKMLFYYTFFQIFCVMIEEENDYL